MLLQNSLNVELDPNSYGHIHIILVFYMALIYYYYWYPYLVKYDSLAPLFFQLVITRSCNLKIKLPWNLRYQPRISLQTNNRDAWLHSTCKVASSPGSGKKTMLRTSQLIFIKNYHIHVIHLISIIMGFSLDKICDPHLWITSNMYSLINFLQNYKNN